MAAAPTAEGTAGLSGSYSTTTSEIEAKVIEKRRLYHNTGYQIASCMILSRQLPPKTKVVAMITTWAVTYESTTTTEITVDMT